MLVKKLGAEFLGTFLLVLGGCGSAIFAARALAPTTGKVGMKFWVVDASADGSVEAQKLHTIKLKMKPVTDGEGSTLISSSEKK